MFEYKVELLVFTGFDDDTFCNKNAMLAGTQYSFVIEVFSSARQMVTNEVLVVFDHAMRAA